MVGALKATEERYPAIGEISFFLGIPQVYTFKGKPTRPAATVSLVLGVLVDVFWMLFCLISPASNNSEVKLLTLSKDDYEEVKDRFPDARDILIGNVRSLLSLGKDGKWPGKPFRQSTLS